MITLTAEQAQQIEEALEYARNVCAGSNWSTDDTDEALAAIHAARAQEQAEQEPDDLDWITPEAVFEAKLKLHGIPNAPQPVKQEPVAWYDKIKGMEVSVDVSTGEDDIHHRIFGRVDGVMLQSCGAQEDTILVIEDSRNFAAPVRTKDLTPHEITALIREGAADGGWQGFAQRVIAKFKEKNK